MIMIMTINHDQWSSSSSSCFADAAHHHDFPYPPHINPHENLVFPHQSLAPEWSWLSATRVPGTSPQTPTAKAQTDQGGLLPAPLGGSGWGKQKPINLASKNPWQHFDKAWWRVFLGGVTRFRFDLIMQIKHGKITYICWQTCLPANAIARTWNARETMWNLVYFPMDFANPKSRTSTRCCTFRSRLFQDQFWTSICQSLIPSAMLSSRIDLMQKLGKRRNKYDMKAADLRYLTISSVHWYFRCHPKNSGIHHNPYPSIVLNGSPLNFQVKELSIHGWAWRHCY